MTVKKVFSVACILLGSSLAVAQEALVSLSPATGDFLESQKFDIAINVSPLVPLPDVLSAPIYDPTTPNAPVRITAAVNSVDATGWINECIQEHRTAVTANRVLLCKSLDYSPFLVGPNQLKVSITDGAGGLYTAQATYNLIASDRKARSLPYRFEIKGTSMNTATGIKVALNDRLNITGTGYVNTWPANTSFPISTYRGTQVCASNSTCLLPGAPVGALLVKIGQYGRWVYVAGSSPFVADRPGELIFAVNDKTEQAATSDNTGSYLVTVAKY
jgi:hypothetical protein